MQSVDIVTLAKKQKKTKASWNAHQKRQKQEVKDTHTNADTEHLLQHGVSAVNLVPRYVRFNTEGEVPVLEIFAGQVLFRYIGIEVSVFGENSTVGLLGKDRQYKITETPNLFNAWTGGLFYIYMVDPKRDAELYEKVAAYAQLPDDRQTRLDYNKNVILPYFNHN